MNTNNIISPRETEVLKLLVGECTTREIAERLFISRHTAETHRKNLLTKLKARNTAGLVRRAFEHRIVSINF